MFPKKSSKTPKEISVPPKESLPLNPVSIIKAVIFFLLHLGATFLLAYACKMVIGQYLDILMFKPETLNIGIWILAALVCYVITSGLMAILMKPDWLIYPVFAASTLLLVLYLGTDMPTILMGLVFWGMSISYALSVDKLLANQIKFTMHPLVSANMMLIMALVIVFSCSLAFGYSNDAAKRNFVIPPQYKESAVKFFFESIKTTLEKQKLPEDAKKTTLEKAQKDTQKMLDDLETQLKPSKPYIPVGIGIMAFITLQSVIIIIGGIPLLLLSVIIAFLKLVKVINVKTEMKEVSSLVL